MSEFNRPIRESYNPTSLVSRGVPRKFVDVVYGEFKFSGNIDKIIRRYLENIPIMFRDSVNLLLTGPNGTGKTLVSSLIVKEAYLRRFQSRMITYQELLDLNLSKEEEEQDKFRIIISSEFLVIDEVGKEIFAKSGYNITRLEEIIRKRDTLGYPTIVCTNLNPRDLKDTYGNSIDSLIRGNSLTLVFSGSDNRPQALREKEGVRILMED